MRTDVKPRDIERWINEYVKEGMILVFESNGTKYGHFISWEKFQHLDKRVHRKYPEPPVITGDSPGKHGRTPDSPARKELELEGKGKEKELEVPPKVNFSQKGKSGPEPLKAMLKRLEKTHGNQAVSK